MAEPARPKRVVVVDAENPLQEVHGEFFWREDHDAIVAAERTAAFQQGFADGLRGRTQSNGPRAGYRKPAATWRREPVLLRPRPAGCRLLRPHTGPEHAARLTPRALSTDRLDRNTIRPLRARCSR